MQNTFYSWQRNINLAVFLFFSLSLIFAFAVEIIYKISPCHLCVYLRYIYWVVLSISILRLKWPQSTLLRWVQFLIIVFALGLSGFHAGVEMKLWDAPAVCNNPVFSKNPYTAGMTVQEKMMIIRKNIDSSELVRCDQVNWRILGISATIWNTLALTLVALLLLMTNRLKLKCKTKI